MGDQVYVVEDRTLVTVDEDHSIVLVEETGVEVITVGVQGPPGPSGASGDQVESVNGRTGAVTLAKSDVGLSNVDNTSDIAKPVSTATQSALDGKAAKDALVHNVRDYGAIGNGIADDTTAIQLAQAAAAGGVVYFPNGVYLTAPLTLESLQTLLGESKDGAIIKLKDDQDADLIQTVGFDALSGTDTTNGVYGFSIENLTLDGNKDHNAGGNVLSIYGWGYRLENVNIREGSGWGIWSEYGSQSLPSTDVAVEGKIVNFVVHDNHAGGIYFKGPHDSHLYDGVVYYNGHNQAGSINIHVAGEQFSNGTVFHNVHTWGGTYDHSYYIEATGISIRDCQIEGSTVSHVVVAADQLIIDNSKIFSIGTSINTVKGIVLIDGANNLYVRAKFEDCGGGMIDFNGAGVGHSVEGFGVHYSGGSDSVAIVGTIPASSFVRIWHLDGDGLPVDEIFHFPGKVQTGDIEATQLVVLPETGNGTAAIESAPGSSQAQLTLKGHHASNNGDYYTDVLRTDQADLVQSVYDASATTFHQLFEFDYLVDRVKHAINQDVWQKGGYNSPSNENQIVLVHRDNSDNATKPTTGIALQFDADDFTGTLTKHARIYAERASNWANDIDVVIRGFGGGSGLEVARFLGSGNVASSAAPTSGDHLANKTYVDTKAADNAVVHLAGTETITGAKTFSSGVTMSSGATMNATNIVTDTTTGLKIGTSTTQKIGFFNVTPVAQQAATADLATVLASFGLRASGTSWTLSTAGSVAFGGNIRETPANITATTTLTTTSAKRQRIVASTAGITVTFPATTTAGIVYHLFRADATGQTVTLNGTFIGTTPNLNAQGKWCVIVTTTTSGTFEVWGSN